MIFDITEKMIFLTHPKILSFYQMLPRVALTKWLWEWLSHGFLFDTYRVYDADLRAVVGERMTSRTFSCSRPTLCGIFLLLLPTQHDHRHHLPKTAKYPWLLRKKKLTTICKKDNEKRPRGHLLPVLTPVVTPFSSSHTSQGKNDTKIVTRNFKGVAYSSRFAVSTKVND